MKKYKAPANDVFTDDDWQIIVRTAALLGGVGVLHGPNLTVEDKNLVTLSLNLGYKFTISRERRVLAARNKSSKGWHNGPYVDHYGFLCSVYIEGEEVETPQWHQSIEAVLGNCYSQIAHYAAQNIGNEIEMNQYAKEMGNPHADD